MANDISGFLPSLRREARHRLPADKANEVVAEVESHVTETAEALMERGMNSEGAFAEATRPFQPVRGFVKAVEDSIYRNRWGRIASNVTFAVAVLLTLVVLSICVEMC